MWKNILILVLAASFNTFQTKAEMSVFMQDTVTVRKEKVSEESAQIIDYVEVMPQFPGGDAALARFLKENIVYPEKAADYDIQGRVVLRFVVTPNGSIENIEVLKSLDSLCDSEAIRVIKKMPTWIPGTQNGHPLSVHYTLPVVFKLQNRAVSAQQILSTFSDINSARDFSQIIHANSDTVMPYFPGGEVALMNWLKIKTDYPEEAVKQYIEGSVVVRFVVAPDGSIKEVELLKSVHPLLDAEALRIVSKMPKWVPGTANGKPVYVYYTLPLLFRLP